MCTELNNVEKKEINDKEKIQIKKEVNSKENNKEIFNIEDIYIKKLWKIYISLKIKFFNLLILNIFKDIKL